MKRLLTGLILTGAMAAHAADAYRVEMQLYRNHSLVATPVMQVISGEQARIGLGDDLSLMLVVEPGDSEGRVDLVSHLEMDGQWYAPRMRLVMDKPASIGMGELRMRVRVSRAVKINSE